jgi:hypothetical protein
MVVHSPSPPPPGGWGKGRRNVGKKLRENLPQAIRKVRVNGILKHGIRTFADHRYKNRCTTKIITTLVSLRSRTGNVYKTVTHSPVIGIKYVIIPLGTQSEYVAQNKETETLANVTICNSFILPKFTSPLYCTATHLCTVSVYCALCTPAKINDVQTNQPIGMGQRVYTNKANNIGRGGGGACTLFCASP